MPLSNEALEAFFQAFLNALDDPLAGERLFHMYANDAPFFYQLSITTPREIGAEAFKHYHQAAHAGHLYATRPTVEDLKFQHFSENGPMALVAWFSAREGQARQELSIAVGFILEEDAWKIGWLTVCAAPEDWCYATGKLQMLAEYGYTKSGELKFPRSGLDVAFFRQFGHAKPKLLTLPDARFSCHMSGGCCTIDHAIHLDLDAQRVIDALPQEQLPSSLQGTLLPRLPNGYLELKQNGQPCRFLDENKHCRIHQAVGRAVFPPCSVFPFAFSETPDGIAVTASPSCSSVRANLGMPLAKKSADLHERLAMSGISIQMPQDLKLNPQQPIGWEPFKMLENQLLANLERHELPIRRRLWLGIRLLELGENDPVALAIALDEPIPPCEGPNRDLAQITLHGLLTHTTLLAPGNAPLPDTELSHMQAPWLLNSLSLLYFSKQYAYGFDLVTAHNTAILFYVLALAMASAAPQGELSHDQWAHLGAMFLQNGLKSALAGDTDYGNALRGLLAQPDFGRALLGFMRLSPIASEVV
jgi:Fe-S-cluster containining protein